MLVKPIKLDKEKYQVYNKPIKLLMFYFFGLFILYILGPMEWKTKNAYFLYLFLFLSHILLYFGYKKTIYKFYTNEENASKTNFYPILTEKTILKLLRVLIILNLIMTVLFLIRTIGSSSFSLDQIISNIKKGITSAGDQYYTKFTTEKVFGGDILAPLYTLLSPILWPVLPMSIIYFRKLNLTSKILVILTVFFELARWLSTGTNKGVVDIILILVSILFLKRQQNILSNSKKNIKKNKKVRTMILAILLIVAGLSIFQNNISSRVDNNYIIISSITNYTPVNVKSPLMMIVPQSIQPLIVYTTVYLTQGYYGLSLTLDEPFIPMFGVGNSYFLMSNFEQIFGIDLYKYSYQSRIYYEGWDPFVNWHSIYSWLANDLSYFGVLLLMYLLGKYFAIVYYHSVVNKDPLISVLFCLLVICFFYFPCNNQILSTPSTFMAFWGLNIYWFYKINKKRKILKSAGK